MNAGRASQAQGTPAAGPGYRRRRGAYEDNSFVLVVSSLAIHNIRGCAGRQKTITEALRVLRPGGRLLIADVRATREYQEQLAKCGTNQLVRRRLGWRFWWGGPWAATRLVAGTKPSAGF